MTNEQLYYYWLTIPVGAENAIDYGELCKVWNMNRRSVRCILHELSAKDDFDNYIIIRSAKGKGFYKTDDPATIIAYRKECLRKGRSNFAPVNKINRVLSDMTDTQTNIFNNMQAVRVAKGFKQKDVVEYMNDQSFDASVLSKLENGVFIPTPYQLTKIARFYGCKPSELVSMDLLAANIYGAI